MNYQKFPRWFAILLLPLGTWAATERASANATPSVPLKLEQQVARADHVAHVVIERIESLDQVDNGPGVTCGSKYHVRVVELFKGKLDSVTAFVNQRPVLPQKRLEAGDHVLVLLRAVTGIAHPGDLEGERSIEELEAASVRPATEACRRARGDLYLTRFAENIFLIRTPPESDAWLEFSRGGTIISPEIGTPTLAPCKPQPGGGCVMQGPDRIEWERVRRALIAAGKRTN